MINKKIPLAWYEKVNFARLKQLRATKLSEGETQSLSFESQFLHRNFVRIVLLWHFNNLVCYFSFIEIICQDPGDIDNGNKQIYRRNRDEDYVAVGDRAEYNCFPGYKMEGSKYLTCTNSGEWNRAKPKCVCKYLKSLEATVIVLDQV